MKRIIISEAQAKILSTLNEKIDKFAFKSHVKDYIKKLLSNPVSAQPDEFLIQHGFNGETLKKELEDANIIIKSEKIINSGGKDKFVISYKVPAENFVRKLTRLYNRLCEENIIEGTILNECDCGGCLGGATNANITGNAETPITPFSKQVGRRKIANVSQDVNEEVVMDTPIGDFGYDAPGLKTKKKDPAYNHKNMIKKSFKGE